MTLAVSAAVLLAALLHAGWNAMIKGGRDVLLDTAAIVAGAWLLRERLSARRWAGVGAVAAGVVVLNLA